MNKLFSMLILGFLASTMSFASAAATLTDNEIAAIVDTANAGEIEAGNYAESHAKSDEVKNFAKHMVEDHTEMDKASKMMVGKLGLKPQENATSKMLKDDSDKSMQKLKQLQGAEFDKAYIDDQIHAHQTVLDTMDKELLPNAKHIELKHSLTNSRVKVAKHLDMAKKLQSGMR